MRFIDIQIGQKFKFVPGYGGANRPDRLKNVVYEKTEGTPPRDKTFFDFQSKNAIYTNTEYEGLRIFFAEEKNSADCFVIVN